VKLSTNIKNACWTEIGFRWQLVHIALIVLAGAAVYSNTFHVQFILDDYNIRTFENKDFLGVLLHGGSRRVADASFVLNYQLHGLQVAGYHLVNLAIHLSAAITLYYIVVSSLSALDVSVEESVFVWKFLPFSVALLFAVHPIQTQAVTYLIQRYTSLATFFYLLSALLFIRTRLAWSNSSRSLYPLFLATLSLAAGMLAVGSKQIAVTLPLMLLILELFLFHGRMFNRRFFLVFGALSVIALVVILIQWHDRSLQEFLVTLHRATSEDHYTSRYTYFLTQMPVVATYLGLLCLPVGQNLLHSYHTYTTIISVPVIASIALHTSLITAAAVLFRVSGRKLRTDNRLKAVLQRLVAMGIIWFYLAISLESSFFPITDVIFEHRIYLPSAGFFLAAVCGFALLAHGRSKGPKVAWLLVAVISIALGGLTVARNHIWTDSLALWQDTVDKNPTNGLAVANLAGEHMKLDMPEKALPLFVRALELNQVFLTNTKVYLGMTLQQLGVDGSRFTTGEEIFSPVERLGKGEMNRSDKNRLQSIMYNNMGLAYEYLGRAPLAKEPYRAALTINPSYDLAWYNLGLLAIRLGDREQVINAMSQLKKLNPSLAESLEKATPR
jgi:tetratricopeptide (TPR) repeat protein